MTTKDEALKQALDALEFSKSYLDDLADVHGTSKKAKPGSASWHVDRAITACRAALAQKDERDSEEALRAIILRREAVIKVLERDAHEAHQRASNAIGTRKVLWNLLGECSPLLHQLECDDAEIEDRLNSLLQRIDDARSVVQAEELPGAVIAKATGEQP